MKVIQNQLKKYLTKYNLSIIISHYCPETQINPLHKTLNSIVKQIKNNNIEAKMKLVKSEINIYNSQAKAYSSELQLAYQSLERINKLFVTWMN